MKTIGVRELRQRASEYLRRVQAGETVAITDRGRPIALLTPIPAGDAIERLIAMGRMSRAEGDVLALGKPLRPTPGAPLPSELLTRARADER